MATSIKKSLESSTCSNDSVRWSVKYFFPNSSIFWKILTEKGETDNSKALYFTKKCNQLTLSVLKVTLVNSCFSDKNGVPRLSSSL